MKQEKKIKKKHIDYSCGFPIILINVPQIKIQNEWIPDINYDQLAKKVLQKLCFKAFPLTGNEIRFIRHYFQMTTRQFAALFHIAHTAVTKWESYGDKLANISWGTELAIRLFIIDKFAEKPKEFQRDYHMIIDLEFSKYHSDGKFCFDIQKEQSLLYA